MKLMLVSILALFLIVASCSDDGIVIQFDRLPEASQSFLEENFFELTPLVISFDGNEYEVFFTNGSRVEFNRKGSWKEVSCPNNSVPAEIVPAEIKAKINDLYYGSLIVNIDRDRHGYDVRLNIGVELEFDKNNNLRGGDFND